MPWLWLISVGVSDIQFPLYKKDQYGQWSEPLRFEKGREGIRSVHDGLLTLLKHKQIVFPSENDKLPKPISRIEARDIKLEFELIEERFLVTIAHEQYQISNCADTIPNDQEQQLLLYCPKIDPLLNHAQKLFGEEPVTAVVLNTNRNAALRDGPDEPIASGPLVAKFLAERLKLKWIDNQGNVPDVLEQKSSTWIDILVENEKLEDVTTQNQVVKRLTSTINAWKSNYETDLKVVVTTSGGMPPLKSTIERVPATCFGQQAIMLLEQPERKEPAVITPLDYNARVSEQEALRFHCAEALRACDYVSAYGLARRYPDLPWSGSVKNLLGPLLELSQDEIQICKEPYLKSLTMTACQIEVGLAMGDSIGAMRRLGVFLESAVWVLIMRNERLKEHYQAKLNRDKGNFEIYSLSDNDEMISKKLLESKGDNRYKIQNLTSCWPDWLIRHAGEQQETARTLRNLCKSYEKEDDQPYKLRDLRNRLAHGSESQLKIDDVDECLIASNFIKGKSMPYGKNFLAAKDVKNLLIGIGVYEQTKAIGDQLNKLLDAVIKGTHV